VRSGELGVVTGCAGRWVGGWVGGWVCVFVAPLTPVCTVRSALPLSSIFDNPKMKRIVIKSSDLLRLVALFLVCEMAFMVVWMFVSSFTHEGSEVLVSNVAPLLRTTCESSYSEFPTALFVWKAVQLGTGLFFAFKVRACPRRVRLCFCFALALRCVCVCDALWCLVGE